MSVLSAFKGRHFYNLLLQNKIRNVRPPGRTLRIIGPYCQGFCCWDAIGHGLPQERSSPAKFDFGSVDQSSSKSPWQGAALLDRYFFAWSMEISRGRDSGVVKKTVESRRIDRRVERLGWGGCFTVKNAGWSSQGTSCEDYMKNQIDPWESTLRFHWSTHTAFSRSWFREGKYSSYQVSHSKGSCSTFPLFSFPYSRQ